MILYLGFIFCNGECFSSIPFCSCIWIACPLLWRERGSGRLHGSQGGNAPEERGFPGAHPGVPRPHAAAVVLQALGVLAGLGAAAVMAPPCGVRVPHGVCALPRGEAVRGGRGEWGGGGRRSRRSWESGRERRWCREWRSPGRCRAEWHELPSHLAGQHGRHDGARVAHPLQPADGPQLLRGSSHGPGHKRGGEQPHHHPRLRAPHGPCHLGSPGPRARPTSGPAHGLQLGVPPAELPALP